MQARASGCNRIPRTTPEVGYLSTPLPTPMGTPTDTVQVGTLRVPDPGLNYRPFAAGNIAWKQVRPDDPVWTESPASEDGVRLSNGGTRYGGPHQGRIEGLEVDGLPVEYVWKGHNYWWMLALDDVVDNLLLASDEAKRKVDRGKVTAPNGVQVPYQRLEAENGAQRLIMTLPGDRTLNVNSHKPLAKAAVESLCSGFAECPEVALRGLSDVFVVESLGEKIDDQGQGPAHPLSAITRAGVPDIVFVHERLCDPVLGRHVVLHEVGHLVDGLESVGSVSSCQTDEHDRPLFGQGAPVDPDHAFDLRHDEYVSHYASLSGKEDFAEIHAVVMKQRTEFNIANPGHDLLTEPPQIASAWLSPRLGLKAEAVVERYRQLGHTPPPKKRGLRGLLGL